MFVWSRNWNMYLPVLLHNRCLAIVFCSLITMSQAQSGAPNMLPSQQFQHPSSSSPTSQNRASSAPNAPPKAQQQHHLGNSYNVLSIAMQKAVSHEFSKWSYLRQKQQQLQTKQKNQTNKTNPFHFVLFLNPSHIDPLSMRAKSLNYSILHELLFIFHLPIPITYEDMQSYEPMDLRML